MSKLDNKALEIKSKEVEEKRLELEKQRGFPVRSFIFANPNGEGFIHGFLEEPTRETKEMVNDLYMQGQISRGDNLMLEMCLIKEESSPETYMDNPKRDANLDMIRAGAQTQAQSFIKLCFDISKKN